MTGHLLPKTMTPPRTPQVEMLLNRVVRRAGSLGPFDRHILPTCHRVVRWIGIARRTVIWDIFYDIDSVSDDIDSVCGYFGTLIWT